MGEGGGERGGGAEREGEERFHTKGREILTEGRERDCTLKRDSTLR